MLATRIASTLLTAIVLGSCPAAAGTLSVFENDAAGWQAAIGSVFVTEDFSDTILVAGLAIFRAGTRLPVR